MLLAKLFSLFLFVGAYIHDPEVDLAHTLRLCRAENQQLFVDVVNLMMRLQRAEEELVKAQGEVSRLRRKKETRPVTYEE